MEKRTFNEFLSEVLEKFLSDAEEQDIKNYGTILTLFKCESSFNYGALGKKYLQRLLKDFGNEKIELINEKRGYDCCGDIYECGCHSYDETMVFRLPENNIYFLLEGWYSSNGDNFTSYVLTELSEEAGLGYKNL